MIRFVTVLLGLLSTTTPTIPDLSTLPRARATLDPAHHTLVIELVPVDLAAASSGMSMLSLPTQQLIIPASGSIYSIQTAVIDSAGNELPRPFLHHVNLRDPNRRDLFLSTGLHILAASKETPNLDVPQLVLGLPLERGQRLLATAMLNNPTDTPYHGVRIRLTFGYRLTEGFAGSVFPLFRAYPWVLDVKFPLGTGPDGSLAFDLPPGQTVQSWESSPAISGYVLGLGGHVHDFATELELTDATTGQVIWRQKPVKDSSGHVLEMPITKFYRWYRLGLRIEASHRYRITVRYDNPTGQTLHGAGMGAVAGLFVPDRGKQWPMVDTTDAVYRQDLSEAFLPVDMKGMDMEH
ncbi:MAG TPA: hypothetical protein VK807_22150 [Gemmatimonadaceae bacterium]|jgi:hypothetical protein|nr:hypothetical protein [Gemmatimonadaceae bacterium]